MNNSKLRALLRDPVAMMRFQATGRLPQGTRPESPLITLLESIPPHVRARIRGVAVDSTLGYAGSRTFHSAEQALRWLKPADEMYRSWPAESWRIANFQRRLTLDDLAKRCASIPADFRRPTGIQQRAGSLAQSPAQARAEDDDRSAGELPSDDSSDGSSDSPSD